MCKESIMLHRMSATFPLLFAFRIPPVILDWPLLRPRRTGKDWTPASGKGMRKDGSLYPADQQGSVVS